MHAHVRHRGSLATDPMEPGRPVADLLILDVLEDRVLRHGDVFETREACAAPVCRSLVSPPD